MTTPATTHTRAASTERAVAMATSVAPVAIGVLAPFLDGGAAFTADIVYGIGAGFLAVNYMNRLPDNLVGLLPAGDVVRAHRSPLFISTLTTGMALGMGTLLGPQGTDALMAGVLTLPSIPGIVSLGWWAAVALVPYKLRNVLRRRRAVVPAAAPVAVSARMPAPPPTGAEQILKRWAQFISHPNDGAYKGQELTVRTLGPNRWTGTITALAGSSVTVTAEVVSSVYQVPTPWISFKTGAHSGERHIAVNLVAPPELDTSTLVGAWRKWVARKGGLMDGTHLENIQDDPNTGGQVAVVVAGEDLDRLRHPDRVDLAGAMRTTPLLISYEPRQDPRKAVIRLMKHNPLQKGAVFPGTHVLKANGNGYVQLGVGISGFPTRIQIYDPNLGAQHVIVCGVTGSGKGGTLQLIALAHHVNRSAIIYADPKGSSNPAIVKMAAYSGLGLDGPDNAIGALRIWYHGLMHRVDESARLEMKNFKPSQRRPWAPLILDEASKLLGENAEYKKEATFIINAGATLGRSIGMPVVGANQILQLKDWGGDAAIRNNMFLGGSLILHRNDSDQKHLIDLPENFAGCNPADLPAAWSGERDLVYDPSKPDNDPERTFALAFAASPGAHAEMSRMWILEDATPCIDTDNIAYPVDWPFWDDRHALAEQSVLPADQADEGDEDGFLLGPVGMSKKPASADDKIVAVLEDLADPLGLEAIYTHKDQIGALAKLEGSTLDNALSRLTKTGKIHRQTQDGKEVRGMYGLGPGQ